MTNESNQANYPIEFLNSINISGLPPHKLILKKSQPIMLLRNINPTNALCNGSRLKVVKVQNRLIQAEVAFGSSKGKQVFIPRMPLIPTETKLPFKFQRLQFPIRPAYAITINKSQGQTLDFVSLWLGDKHVFSHGQLYVALSRVSSIKNIIIASDHSQKMTRNIVFREVFL